MKKRTIYIIGIVIGIVLGAIFGLIGFMQGATIGIATGGTAFAATVPCCCSGWLIGLLVGLIPIVVLLSLNKSKQKEEK